MLFVRLILTANHIFEYFLIQSFFLCKMHFAINYRNLSLAVRLNPGITTISLIEDKLQLTSELLELSEYL